MADLAEMGFLAQPHTSAGRIPSAMGYRFYIDRLMRVPLLTRQEQSYVDSVLQPNAFDPEKLLGSATEVIAELTRMAAVATTPSGSSAVIRGVQFVQVGRRTAMILLMSSAGTIKSRIFHCHFDLSQDVLRVFFRLLNGKLAGRPVSSITPAFVQSLLASFGEMAVLMSSALRALLDVVNDTIWTRVCLSGQMNLLYYPEYDRSSARRVMDLLDEQMEAEDAELEYLRRKYKQFDGWPFFSIECRPNPELYSLLSSYGGNLVVLEPSSIRTDMLKRALAAAENYGIVVNSK